jgi:hypothetical protein
MKEIWTGRAAQVVGKYGEQAPMATVCCNACRTCVTTNVLAFVSGAAAWATLAVRRRLHRPAASNRSS